jgi:hypothetical protein
MNDPIRRGALKWLTLMNELVNNIEIKIRNGENKILNRLKVPGCHESFRDKGGFQFAELEGSKNESC